MKIALNIAESGAEALRSRLLSDPPALPLRPTRSDFDLNPLAKPERPRDLKPAAVLVPIVQRKEPTILFTRRTEHLARHAGQVSFPGGRLHSDDRSLVETALRETEEETGIAAHKVAVAGFLDSYETVTGFGILPVVGIVPADIHLEPNPHEVAEAFEVPLAFLLDPQNCRRESRIWKEQAREFHAFDYGPHYIWGATAAILVNLRERLCGEDAPQ